MTRPRNHTRRSSRHIDRIEASRPWIDTEIVDREWDSLDDPAEVLGIFSRGISRGDRAMT